MPLSLFAELAAQDLDDSDLAPLLGVEKWEPPMPAGGSSELLGPFPTALARKTDAERVQNLVAHYTEISARRWIAMEKVDGTSATYIRDEAGLRVCGRNYELTQDSQQGERAVTHHLLERMLPGEVVQAELYGEGVQANPLKRSRQLAVFGFFRDRVSIPRAEWPAWLLPLAAPVVPIDLPKSVDAAVAQVDGMRSVISPERAAEGVVWHTADGAELPCLEGRGCFKVISNKYLLKQD